MDIALGEADKSEILRYLEYHNQKMEEGLHLQVDACMKAVNQAVHPRHILREFTNLQAKELQFLVGEDIQRHLKDCERVILFAATLGTNVELAIRRAGVRNIADAVIMDSCASTLMEVYCNQIEADLRVQYRGKYLTTRFSPGYGDLPISVQLPFLTLLDTARKIGLGVSESMILIPRKSVTAILGVSDTKPEKKECSCQECNHNKACRFLRKGVTCGR